MTREQVQAFFERYREAFSRLDGDAVADLWHTGSGITDGGNPDGSARLTWWADDAPMRDNMRRLCAAYRDAGFVRCDFTLRAFVPMGPAHAFAHLDWTLTRADGSVLQAFATGYQLVRTADGLRVLLAVAHSENLAAMKAASGG